MCIRDRIGILFVPQGFITEQSFYKLVFVNTHFSKITKILFPIVVTMLAGLVAPASVALVGFLMFGNLLRECGVLNALSETAQNVLANLCLLYTSRCV